MVSKKTAEHAALSKQAAFLESLLPDMEATRQVGAFWEGLLPDMERMKQVEAGGRGGTIRLPSVVGVCGGLSDVYGDVRACSRLR